ncbi:Outer membrane efflux protein [Azospirillaceae bacterium]
MLLAGHERVSGARADLRAATSNVEKSRSGWYPELSVTANVGRQRVERSPPETVANFPIGEAGVTVRQPVYDFGRIDAEVGKAKIAQRQAEVTLDNVTQEVLFEGLTAFVNLERAALAFQFASESEDNIRHQTGLEQSMVDLGGGFSSDVLQAKSQLAGAQARLVRARGSLLSAENRFRAVFRRPPILNDRTQRVSLPSGRLPATMDEAVTAALDRNRQLILMRLDIDSGKAEIERQTGAELMPRLAAVGESRYMRNSSGVFGNRMEQTVKLEMTYRFNTGLSAHHGLDAAREQVSSSQHKYIETLDLIEERVRNAWESLEVARENANHLENQARISEAFLQLAREERVQGRRSLIDVLSGETSLINAQSDAASAKADVVLASFSLLRAIGALDLEILSADVVSHGP